MKINTEKVPTIRSNRITIRLSDQETTKLKANLTEPNTTVSVMIRSMINKIPTNPLEGEQNERAQKQ